MIKKFKQFLGLIRKFYGYLKKDLMLFYRRKKYLYMFLLFPVLIAIIFLILLSPSTSEIDVGICNLDESEIIKDVFSDIDGFNTNFIDRTDCEDKLYDNIEEGKYPLGLIIGEDFSKNIDDLKQASLTVVYDNTDIAFSNFVSWSIDQSLRPFKKEIIDQFNQELKSRVSVTRDSISVALDLSSDISAIYDRILDVDSDLKKVEELDTDFLVDPIVTRREGIYDMGKIEFISLSFLFPIISLFLVLMLASTSLIYDKKNGFITKVKTSTSPIVYLISKLFFFYLLTSIVLISLLAIFFLFGISINLSLSHIPELLKLILSISIINTLIGLLIGLISENEGVAVLISLIISFPLMLLSGLFFPVQTMPSFIQSFSKFLPLHYQIEASKSIFLFNQNLNWSWIYFGIVLLFLVYFLIRRD